MKAFVLAASALAIVACHSSAANDSGGDDPNVREPASGSTSQADSCGASGDLLGATWTIQKSRFAFGGTPVETPEGNNVTAWIGADGRATMQQFGYVGASLNGGVATRPDWSNDPTALTQHVEAYLMAFGIPSCQVRDTNILGGSGGRAVILSRAVDGILIVESHANASLDDLDQSQQEEIFWPTIPAAALTAAKAFRDQLKDPTALAAYKAKLPDGSRGDGQVMIHHTFMVGTTSTFKAVATWDVITGDETLSYDQNGALFMLDF